MEFLHACYSTADDEVELAGVLFSPNLSGCYVGQTEFRCNLCYYCDFFSDGINQVELGLWKQDGKGNTRKSPSGTYIKDFTFRQKTAHLGDAKRVQDVIRVQVIHILSGNHVDSFVPLLVKRPKLREQCALHLGEIQEILFYNLLVVHEGVAGTMMFR